MYSVWSPSYINLAMAMFLLSLSMLALLQLGATQQFVVLTRNQLREEIRAGITAALTSTANQSPTPLNILRNDSRTCNNFNTSLWELVDRLSTLQLVQQQMNGAIQHTAMDIIANISNSFEQLLSPIMTELRLLHLPGSTPSHPAASCREIKELNPTAPSGYYWLRGTGDSSIHMYCDMSRSCGGITGGWMTVAKINMTNSSHTCPAGLKLLTTPKRLCARNIDRGCSSATFNLHGIRYTHVCGKIIGYQQGTPDAFGPYWWGKYHNNHNLTIDQKYVEGISLTHGHNPRKHIWTFAAALDEVQKNYNVCPCTNIHNTVTIPIPPYVGSDYFCDTASETIAQIKFYPNDPLWDGQGCGRLNTCCSFNSPPWFMKELPSSTSDDIEMRLCAGRRHYEDINFEVIELFVL